MTVRSPRCLVVLTVTAALAGCAGSSPAPVTSRSEGTAPAGTVSPGGSTVGPASSMPRTSRPAPSADTAAAAGVTVIPLEPARAPPSAPSNAQAPASGQGPGPVGPDSNPAVLALVERAERESRDGRPANAAASLERAIRIEPGNARLWHRLAAARLAQRRLGDAASMAARSNALAAGDDDLQAANWRIIAQVHRARGEEVAADAAEERAQRLSPRRG